MNIIKQIYKNISKVLKGSADESIKIMNKIKPTDNTSDVIIKLCDGNIGAMNCLIELFEEPSLRVEFSLNSLFLDSLQINGTDIYVLYGVICNKNVFKMAAVIKATRLGLFSSDVLKDA